MVDSNSLSFFVKLYTTLFLIVKCFLSLYCIFNIFNFYSFFEMNCPIFCELLYYFVLPHFNDFFVVCKMYGCIFVLCYMYRYFRILYTFCITYRYTFFTTPKGKLEFKLNFCQALRYVSLDISMLSYSFDQYLSGQVLVPDFCLLVFCVMLDELFYCMVGPCVVFLGEYMQSRKLHSLFIHLISSQMSVWARVILHITWNTFILYGNRIPYTYAGMYAAHKKEHIKSKSAIDHQKRSGGKNSKTSARNFMDEVARGLATYKQNVAVKRAEIPIGSRLVDHQVKLMAAVNYDFTEIKTSQTMEPVSSLVKLDFKPRKVKSKNYVKQHSSLYTPSDVLKHHHVCVNPNICNRESRRRSKEMKNFLTGGEIVKNYNIKAKPLIYKKVISEEITVPYCEEYMDYELSKSSGSRKRIVNQSNHRSENTMLVRIMSYCVAFGNVRSFSEFLPLSLLLVTDFFEVEEACQLLGEIIKLALQAIPWPQSGLFDCENLFNKLFEDWQFVKKTSMFNDMYSSVSIILLAPIAMMFGLKPGYDSIKYWYDKNRDFAFECFQQLNFLRLVGTFLKTGLQYVMTGDVSVFISREKWGQFVSDWQSFRANSTNPVWLKEQGLVDSLGAPTEKYHEKIKNMLLECELLLRFCESTKNSQATGMLHNVCFDIKKFQSKYVLASLSSVTTKPPFTITILGKPGAGKTAIAAGCMSVAATALGIDNSPINKITFNPSDPFFSNYTGQQIVLMHDPVSKPVETETAQVLDWINLLDAHPFMMQGAAIEDKGNKYGFFKLVVLTTNLVDLDFRHRYLHVGAPMRRIKLWIKVISPKDNNFAQTYQKDYVTDLSKYLCYYVDVSSNGIMYSNFMDKHGNVVDRILFHQMGNTKVIPMSYADAMLCVDKLARTFSSLEEGVISDINTRFARHKICQDCSALYSTDKCSCLVTIPITKVIDSVNKFYDDRSSVDTSPSFCEFCHKDTRECSCQICEICEGNHLMSDCNYMPQCEVCRNFDCVCKVSLVPENQMMGWHELSTSFWVRYYAISYINSGWNRWINPITSVFLWWSRKKETFYEIQREARDRIDILLEKYETWHYQSMQYLNDKAMKVVGFGLLTIIGLAASGMLISAGMSLIERLRQKTIHATPIYQKDDVVNQTGAFTQAKVKIFKDFNNYAAGMMPVGGDISLPENPTTRPEPKTYSYVPQYYGPHNIDQLIKKIQSQQIRIRFDKEVMNEKTLTLEKGSETSILTFIGSRTAICTRHGLPDTLGVLQVDVPHLMPIGERAPLWYSGQDAVEMAHDVVRIEIGKKCYKRLDYCTTEVLPGPGKFITPEAVYDIDLIYDDKTFELDTPDIKAFVAYRYKCPGCIKGNSGAIIVSTVNNTFNIVGVHTKGYSDHLVGWCPIFKSIPEPQGLVMAEQVIVNGMPLDIGPLRDKSLLHHYTHDMDGEVYGSLANGHTLRPKTSLVKTIAHDFYKCPLEIPILADRVENGAWISADFRRMYHMLMSMPVINPKMEEFAIECTYWRYAPLISSDLSPDPLLTVFNAYGTGNRTIKLNTSAGFGYPGSKDQYVFPIGDELFPDGRITNAIKDHLYAWENGFFYPDVVSCISKDEPVKPSKNRDGDIRKFYPTAMPLNVLMQQFFGPLFRELIDKRFVIPGCEGVNAANPIEWHKTACKLFGDEYSTLLLDLDGKFWDVLQRFIGMAYEVAYRLLSRCPKYKKYLRILRGIIETNIHTLFVIGGWDLVLLIMRMTSGKFGTTVFNIFSMIIVWTLAAAYRAGVKPDQIIRTNTLEYMKHIKFVNKLFVGDFYGDDNLIALLRRLQQDVVDPEDWRKIFLILGVWMQPGDKGDKITYTTLDKVKFLKRSFTYREGIIYAPLNEDSIYKLLSFYDTRCGITLTEFYNTNIPLMQSCWFMYDKERFDFETHRLQELVLVLQQQPETSAVKFFPFSYEYLMERYIKGGHIEWGL